MRIVLLSVLIISPSAFGIVCQAPSQAMMEDRLRASYKLDSAENELREIVKEDSNYPIREEVKALKRRLRFTSRKKREPIYTELQAKFEQMIQNAETEPLIANFPYEKASSTVGTSEVGTLVMSMKNLNKEELDFLPEETLKKLDPTVKVHYFYPIDKFEYVLTFDGKDLPMRKAFTKMQVEHEHHCLSLKNLLKTQEGGGSQSGSGRASGT